MLLTGLLGIAQKGSFIIRPSGLNRGIIAMVYAHLLLFPLASKAGGQWTTSIALTITP